MHGDIKVDMVGGRERTDVFVSGAGTEAKALVMAILRNWPGWRSIVDLGNTSTLRGGKMHPKLWASLRIWAPSRSLDVKVFTYSASAPPVLFPSDIVWR